MCGITGFVYTDSERPAEADILARMNATLHHRGPDEDGVYTSGNVALAMKRLAIVDLKGGQQPIFNEDRSMLVVMNGEIYNFRELRRALIPHGHRFVTDCDTEVLVHGYEQWGGDGLCQRLNGMFAFAIWDARAGRLTLGRDRMGKKPLHYHYSRRLGIVFGSEIKALLAHPAVPRDPDHAALWHYLALQATPEPASAFRAIRKLPPGHVVEWVPASGRAPEASCYWRPAFEPKKQMREGDWVGAVRESVTAAVRRRLMGEVPLGAFLSGGIDSSIIVGLMARESSQPVRTFTIGFEEEKFSELAEARLVAKHFGTDHREEIVSWNVAETLPRLVEHCDEPFADPAALAMWHLSRMTREHVTVALCGDGGDETHAGYQRHWMDGVLGPVNLLADSGLGGSVAGLWRNLASRLPVRTDIPPERNWMLGVQRIAQALETGPDASLLRWSSYFTDRSRNAIATEEFRRLSGGQSTAALFRRAARRSGAVSRLDRTLAADFPLYLASVLLVKADRMTMAHSLEARSPFLDVDHVDLTAAMPDRFKIRGRVQKYILRRAFAGILPPSILSRPKQGFALPVGAWFRGPLKEMARDTLLSTEARGRGLFNPKAVRALLGEHAKGAEDHGKRLWSLVMLELWFRRYQ